MCHPLIDEADYLLLVGCHIRLAKLMNPTQDIKDTAYAQAYTYNEVTGSGITKQKKKKRPMSLQLICGSCYGSRSPSCFCYNLTR